MKKDLALIGGLFLIIIALLIFGKGFTSSGFVNSGASSSNTQAENAVKFVKIKDLVVEVDVSDSSEERKKGLSKRESMPIDRGMLFVFDKSDIYTIWMKDMKFAIDIIWIGEDKKIVYVAQNVAPEPGKKDNELVRYTPTSAAKYVLEVNAGLTSLHNIAPGDTAEF